MDARRFDRMAAVVGGEDAMSRRPVLGELLGGALGLIAREDAPARRLATRGRRLH